VPAVALGLALLPLARTLTGHTRQRLAVGVLAGLALIVLHDSRGLVDRHPATALLVSGIAFATFVVLWAGPAVPRRLAVVGGAGLLVLVGGLGWAAERRLQRDRYAEIAPWARELENTRIAIVGQVLGYPLYGRDLSNHVQYVARKGAHGAFLRIRSCREWRNALNEGRYRYLVVDTTVNLLLAAHGFSQARPEVEWTGSDPAARRLPVASGHERVFRIDGRLDPRGCRDRSEAAARRLGPAGR
jgi:hypothetical protein